MNLPYSPVPNDFKPLLMIAGNEQIDRPSMSYWQDVWRRLRSNLRALTSLYLVLGLIAFTLLGPLVWDVDPSMQDLEQISQGPTMGRTALLVAERSPIPSINSRSLSAEAARRKTEGTPSLRLLGEAHTEGVTIAWNPLPGASSYKIFRHELEPSSIDDLGLPLAEVGTGQLSYHDSLSLEATTYYYSVVPLIAQQPGESFWTQLVETQQAITLSDAHFRGLVDSATDLSLLGQSIRLAAHPMGTDSLGRDMLARLMWGARTSLFIGLIAPLIYVGFGLLYGGFAGYVGGRMDNALMRFADFVIALPFLLFMILFKIAFGIGPGESGIGPLLVALVLLSWPATARLVRGQVLQIREEPYVAAARLMGAGPHYLVLRHMLPNVMGVLLVSLTFAIPSAIFTEAFLSFIGMGVVPPTPSWGSMCNDGIRTMLSHPHELIFPALLISITVLAFNLLGDGLRDAMDARLRADS
ncbi:MAG: oligopeptide transport system permease protein [Halieaceae bacterium]|jgi:oligopeptide transport system permease protein